MFLETSAKTGENVEEAFLKCSKTILVKIETGECYCFFIFVENNNNIIFFMYTSIIYKKIYKDVF